MVRGVEDLRTPLSTINELAHKIRGSLSGTKMPHFVVDAPGGGGKREARDFDSYDPVSGRSVFTAPAVKDGKKEYEYWDPVRH